MTDEERERAVLGYLSKHVSVPEASRSLTTIFEQLARDRTFRSSFFEDVFGLDDEKEALRAFLDQMARDGLLEAQMEEGGYEPSYRATQQGIYEAAFENAPFILDQDELDGGADDASAVEQPAPIDSAAWTGLSRVGVTYKNAQAIAGLIDTALIHLGSEDNASTAQARTLLLAAKALTEAPEPPSDVIWDLIQRAGAVAGLLDIFFRIFSAAIN